MKETIVLIVTRENSRGERRTIDHALDGFALSLRAEPEKVLHQTYEKLCAQLDKEEKHDAGN